MSEEKLLEDGRKEKLFAFLHCCCATAFLNFIMPQEKKIEIGGRK